MVLYLRRAEDIASPWITDEWYPEAERVTLVVDNLSTHKPSVFYEVFAPEEARRIMGRLEFVYTPKHGSWLDDAECTPSTAGVRSCLGIQVFVGVGWGLLDCLKIAKSPVQSRLCPLPEQPVRRSNSAYPAAFAGAARDIGLCPRTTR